MRTIPVFYDPKMNAEVSSYSPSASKPGKVVNDWLSCGLPVRLLPVERAETFEIGLAHDGDYVTGVLEGSINNGFGTTDKAVADSLPWTVGSMIGACRHVMTTADEVAVSPTSGFHHARYATGGGFCTFNGLVIAAMAMWREGLVDSVGILDCDYHYGDGTEDIIQRLGLSSWMHHWPAGTKALFKTAMKHVDLRSVDLLIYQAGADMHVDDPLGGDMTSDQLRRRDEQVFKARGSLPMVWNLAGGYRTSASGGIEPVLATHRNTLLACIEAACITL